MKKVNPSGRAVPTGLEAGNEILGCVCTSYGASVRSSGGGSAGCSYCGCTCTAHDLSASAKSRGYHTYDASIL